MASELDIKIEGVSLDLFDNEEQNFYLTKQIHDLVNLETRDASFSKTIAVPLTARNTQILEASLPFNYRHTEEPIVYLLAEVLLKGIPVISDAYVLVREQTKKARTINLTVVGGEARFFNQLKEDSLSSLDFTSLNFEWSLDGIRPLVENGNNAPVALYNFNVIGQFTATSFRPTFIETGAGDAFTINAFYAFTFSNVTWINGNYKAIIRIDANVMEFQKVDSGETSGENIGTASQATSEHTELAYTRNSWYTNESRRLYLANNGNDSATVLEGVELGESGFLMFFKTILDKIFFNLNDLTVDYGDLLNDIDFIDSGIYVPVPIVHNSFGAIEGSYSEVQATPKELPEGQQIVVFENIINNDAGYWNPATNQYEFTEAGFFTVKFYITGNSQAHQTYRIYQNFGTDFLDLGFYQHWYSGVAEYEGSILTSANVEIGDTIAVYGDNFTGDGKPSFLDSGSFQLEAQGTGRGRDFSVSSMLPSIGQKTFVKEIFKLYNILAVEKNRVIKLSYFENIPNNAPEELEFNNLNEVVYSGAMFSYGQLNFFKYLANDQVEREDQNTSFPILDLTLTEEVTKIQSEFSSTDNSAVANMTTSLVVPNYILSYEFIIDNKMATTAGSVIFTTQERNDIKGGDFISVAGLRRRVITMISDFEGQVDVAFPSNSQDQDWYFWSFEIQEPLIHIAKLTPDQVSFGANNFTVTDGGIQSTYTVYAKASFTSLLWVNLKEKYYKLLVDSMYRPFIVTGWMAFGTLKYISIDGLQPIYIESLDTYFYMNKIEQWKYNGSTRVELIKINY